MKNKILFILFFLFITIQFSFGQSNPHFITPYPFVNYDSNTVQFFENDLTFSNFYTKFDSLISTGEGKINIMQFGGSHIQADIWSHQVRKNFHNKLNLNGGRGFIFPFKLAKTNNPHYYNITYTGEWNGYRNAIGKHQSTWGVSGITATTTDSVSSFHLEFRGDDTPLYDFNTIKVFHDTDSSSYCLELVSDTSLSSIHVNTELGYTEFKFNKYHEKLAFRIYKTDSLQTHFNLYGLSLENNDNGIVYHSIGVNGASTSSYLRNQLLVPQLKTINPDLVIFCIGINDAFEPGFCAKCFENNYDSLVSRIKQANPTCEFLFVTNTDSYYKKRYLNKRAFEVQAVMQNLAKKHRAGYWDLFTIMGGLGSIKTWERNGLAQKDRVHFKTSGYELMGDLMFSALMKEYARFITIKNQKLNIEN